MEKLGPGEKLEFRYPGFYRVIAVPGTIVPLAIALMLAVGGAGLPGVLLFVAFAGLGVYLFLATLGRVTLDSEGITLTHLGRSTRIAYAEVTRLEHLHVRQALVIHAEGRRIRVEKQLRGFPLFLALLHHHLPPSAKPMPAALPVEVRTSLWVHGLGGVLVAFGLSILGLIAVDWPESGAMGILPLGVAPIAAGIALLWQPRKYVFAPDQVEVHRLTRVEVLALQDLRMVELSRELVGGDPVHVLRLFFGTRWLELREQVVRHSLDLLFTSLSAHFGLSRAGEQAGETWHRLTAGGYGDSAPATYAKAIQPGEKLVFEYAAGERVVGTVSMLLFLPMAIAAALDRMSLLHVATLMAFAGLGLYLFLRTQGRLTLDDEGITLTQLGRSKRIAYAEITRVEASHPRQAIVVHGHRKRIGIKRELRGLRLLCAVLADRLPPQASQPPALPLSVGPRAQTCLAGGVAVALGLVVLGCTLAALRGASAAAGLLIGTALVGAGIAGLWRRLRRYVFAPDRIEVYSLGGLEVYPLRELRSMQLLGLSREGAPVRTLCLWFGRRKLVIPEGTLCYSIDELAEALAAGYGLVPAEEHQDAGQEPS